MFSSFSRVSARDLCSFVGAVWYSTPQWRLTTMNSAPASRVCRAMSSIGSFSRLKMIHGVSAGIGMPLVP